RGLGHLAVVGRVGVAHALAALPAHHQRAVGVGVAVGLAARLDLLAHALLLAGHGLADRLGVALVLLGLGLLLLLVERPDRVPQPQLVAGRDRAVARRPQHLHEARALAQPGLGVADRLEFGHLGLTRADVADLELNGHESSGEPSPYHLDARSWVQGAGRLLYPQSGRPRR